MGDHTGRILIGEWRTKRDGSTLESLGRHFAGVVVARTGRDCAEKAIDAKKSGKPFDVIVISARMPGLDGYSAARLIRDNGVEQPIIAITPSGYLSFHELASEEVGCTTWMSRSEVDDRLVDTIEGYLQH